jgi:phosphate-selective porin OprO/OprP
MKKPTTKIMTAKRLAVAVATVCATLSAPVFAGEDIKGLMDLLLKKGMITQQEYDQNIQAAQDAAENQAFKEKRLSDDVTRLNKVAEKSKDTGFVMKNGLGLQSADGENSIKFIGRVHMDYRAFSSDATGADGYQDLMQIRRARAGFEGIFLKDFDYKLFMDIGTTTGMSSTTTTMDEGYVGYTYNPTLKFRAGRFKMPFSLEQLTSSNNIDFMERSLGGQIEGELVPAKEVGAMIFGAPIEGMSYALAISQGPTATSKTAAFSAPDITGRLSANLSALAGRKDEVAHVGLAFSKGDIGTAVAAGSSTIVKSGRTEGREASAFFTGSVASVDAGATRDRQGIELAYATGPFKVQGEMMKVSYDNVTSTDFSYKTNYIQAVWNITGEAHSYSNSSGTFGWIKPNSKFSNKGGTGALQAGIRYSKFDASDIAVATGKTNGADAMTYGLTWFMNDNTRLMLNYVVTNFDAAVGTGTAAVTKQQAITARAQVSF